VYRHHRVHTSPCPQRGGVGAAATAKMELRPNAPAKMELRPNAPAKMELRPNAPAKMELRPNAPAKMELRPNAPAKMELRPNAPAMISDVGTVAVRVWFRSVGGYTDPLAAH